MKRRMRFTRFSYKSARLRDIEKTFNNIDRALFETTDLEVDNQKTSSFEINDRERFNLNMQEFQDSLGKLNDNDLRVFQNCLDTMRNDLWLHHLIKVKAKANSKEDKEDGEHLDKLTEEFGEF